MPERAEPISDRTERREQRSAAPDVGRRFLGGLTVKELARRTWGEAVEDKGCIKRGEENEVPLILQPRLLARRRNCPAIERFRERSQ